MPPQQHYSTLQVRQSLKMVGFSDNEAKTLLFLFGEKRATAKKVSQNIAIAFPLVQYALVNLGQKGLVKCIPGKDDCYEACSEKKFFEWIDSRKEEHEKIYKIAKKDVHSLLDVLKAAGWKPDVQYFEGFEGVQHVYEDTLKGDHKQIYAFENIATMDSSIKKYILGDYIPRRAKKKIFIQVLGPYNKAHRSTKKADKAYCRETRFFPLDIAPVEIEINIYGAKTAFFSYKKDEMFAVVFDSESIANSMKTIFDLCWRAAERY